MNVLDGCLWLACGMLACQESKAVQETSLELVWTSKTGDWNHAVCLLPWGDAVSGSMWTLRYHARHTGRVLEEFRIPDGLLRGGLGSLGGNRVALITTKGIHECAFPRGKVKAVAAFEEDPSCCAVGRGAVAVGFKSGKVRVYRTSDWATLDDFGVSGTVTVVALAEDAARLAVGTGSGGVLVRDWDLRNTAQVTNGGDEIKVLALSRAGDRLMADAATFKAIVWDLKEGSQLRVHRTGSWLTRAVFLSDEIIAASGSDGLVLYEIREEPVSTLSRESVEGLAAAQGGEILCFGDREGTIGYLSSKRPDPSPYPDLPKEEPESPRRCGKCNQIYPGARYCPNDGSPLQEGASEMLGCPTCRKVYGLGRFCPADGTSLVAVVKTLVCPKCGKQGKEGRFCPIDGAELELHVEWEK